MFHVILLLSGVYDMKKGKNFQITKEGLQRIISLICVFLSFWILNSYLMRLSGISIAKNFSIWISNTFFSISWIFFLIGIVYLFQGIYRRIVAIILFSIFISINSKPVMYAEFELFKKYSFLKYLTFFFIFVLLISYIFFVWKNPTNNVVSALGSTISSRLLMGNEGLHWYGISLFGQPVNFVDSSYIVLNRAYSYSTYFTVDSLYIKLLINEGLFVGFIFLFFIFRALMKSIESNKLIFLIILSLLIYSIFETGLSSPILSYVVAYAFSDGYVKIKATKGGKNK